MSRKQPLKLWHPTGKLTGTVSLPASKSESNRALIIQALTQGTTTLDNLSTANDTQLLQRLLNSNHQLLNAEDAGTVMRFLTAYLAVTNKAKTLTGTARMQQRPIGLLVDALRELGADISYLNQEGYPPLQLNGIDLSWHAQEVSVPGHVSSQFISALLLVAPVLPFGLCINIIGHIASKPYLDMTLELMRHFGATCSWNGNAIEVAPVPYGPCSYSIPADWSSAAYWFSFAALARQAELFLPGLKESSVQADRAVVEIAARWGVEATFTKEGAKLSKATVALPEHCLFNFSNCPDLAPTIMVLAAATGVELTVTGIESLKIKETDRIAALQKELPKIGAKLIEKEEAWHLLPNRKKINSEIFINTYSDHRMAMAFAPLALLGEVVIEQPETVKKSYPDFWRELQKQGFELEEQDSK